MLLLLFVLQVDIRCYYYCYYFNYTLIVDVLSLLLYQLSNIRTQQIPPQPDKSWRKLN